MCYVLDHHRVLGRNRLYIGSIPHPGLAIVFERRARRNHLTQIDFDLFQLADGIQPGTLGQLDPPLFPYARAQGMVLQLGAGDAVDDRAFLTRAADDPGYDLIRLRIARPRLPASILRGRATHTLVLELSRHDLVFEVGHRGKGTRAPADTTLLNGETAQDRGGRAGPVLVFERVLGHQITQFIAFTPKTGQTVQCPGGSLLGYVKVENIGGLLVYRQGNLLLVEQHHVGRSRGTQRKGNALKGLDAEVIVADTRHFQRFVEIVPVGIEMSREVNGRELV